jgi:hypothetical protein
LTDDYQKGEFYLIRGDWEAALREFKPLAEQGYADAQTNLGYMYRLGLGVVKDYKTAVKWYTLAAKQGYLDAQFNLGLMYRKGEGVVQDNVYAHMWYNIAASSGDKVSSRNRESLEKEMTPADISAAQKLARECVRKNIRVIESNSQTT